MKKELKARSSAKQSRSKEKKTKADRNDERTHWV